ncbi:uncharacterized protein LOC113771655 [Coffea eugenioides]|uniref:uncharacterized protein LOC113771655 n=1 Tax=Coffea eugenioides TaxID=49369 RepID=UPI000F608AF6|nr:uncharacterized protein LOC113771655 [Coffea eugenioides]
MSSSPPIPPDTVITVSSGPAPKDPCLDRCVLIGFLSIIFLAFAIVITVALVFFTDAKDPQFQVDSIMVSPLNLSSNVDGTRSHWSIGILVRNPTKLYYLEYQKFYVLVLHNKTEFVSGKTVEPFHQRAKNKTKIVVQTEAALLDGVDRKGGVVGFDLKLLVNTIYLLGQNRRQYSWFDVLCSNLRVEFSSHAPNGTMVGGAKQCSINLMLARDFSGHPWNKPN